MSQTTQDSLNVTPSFLLKTEKQGWQIVISYTHNLSDLRKYQSCTCTAYSKQKKNLNIKREAVFSLWLFNRGSTVFVDHASPHQHMHVHGNATLTCLELSRRLWMESKNNHRASFGGDRARRCVRPSQLPISRAAPVQSLWCCSELPAIKSLP